MTRDELRRQSEAGAVKEAKRLADMEAERSRSKQAKQDESWRWCMDQSIKFIDGLIRSATAKGDLKITPLVPAHYEYLLNNLQYHDVTISRAELAAKIVAWVKFKYPDLDVSADRKGTIHVSWE